MCRSGYGTAAAHQCCDCQQSNKKPRQGRAQAAYPEDRIPDSARQPTAAAGHSLKNPKLLSGKRTPQKRTLRSLDQDLVDTSIEARGHVRGAKEAPRDGSSNARELQAMQHLNGMLRFLESLP